LEGRIPAPSALGWAAPELYRGAMRQFLLPTALLALAAIVALAAVADHRLKQRNINRAELHEWYCQNIGKQCGGPSSVAIERHWNDRQLGYEITVAVVAGAAFLLAASRALRR
jgi:hypothetical protein